MDLPQSRPLAEAAPLCVDSLQVRYFAVYPGGRRCEVTMQSALDNAFKWLNEEDVRVITKLERVPCPVVGTLEQG